MQKINKALKDAVATLLHPKIILATLSPILACIVAFLILSIYAWEQIKNFVSSETGDIWIIHFLITIISKLGIGALVGITSWLSTFLLIFFLSFMIGILVSGFIVTPIAMQVISQKYFPNLERKANNNTLLSTFNTIKVTIIFILGWIVTLPLWLIPPLTFVLPILWLAYMFSGINKVDSLCEHATDIERLNISKENSYEYWIIGLISALLSMIATIGLITPVYAVLVYIHYSLRRLEELRQKEGLNQQLLSKTN